jgi:hypothetical protein
MCRAPEPAFWQILEDVRELRFAAWLIEPSTAKITNADKSAASSAIAFDV